MASSVTTWGDGETDVWLLVYVAQPQHANYDESVPWEKGFGEGEIKRGGRVAVDLHQAVLYDVIELIIDDMTDRSAYFFFNLICNQNMISLFVAIYSYVLMCIYLIYNYNFIYWFNK